MGGGWPGPAGRLAYTEFDARFDGDELYPSYIEHTGGGFFEKQRLFAELRYGARSWGKPRRVIARLEHGRPKGRKGGANPRYVVTNLQGRGPELYDGLYCQRGEMENRIKEQQLDLFADRTSCHKWWPNRSSA